MKERISAVIILIVFALFAFYQFIIGQKSTVIKVITPTLIQIDTNGNNIADKNEAFCIPDITTFTSDTTKNSEIAAKETGLTYGQSLAIGYLADEYAHKMLDYKNVKVELTGEKTPECEYANIYLGDVDYSKSLKESGYALNKLDFSILNKEKFNEIQKRAKNLKLVVLNHHSGKYHTLDCKYGHVAHDAIILPAREVPKDAKPCRFCHVNKHINFDSTEHKHLNDTGNDIPNIVPPPGKMTHENVTLIITDFTRILKPDKTCSHAACKEFVNCINNATKTIDVAAYGWAEIPAVSKAFDSAQKRGVTIRMVYDTNSKKENYYSETNSFLSKFPNKHSDENSTSPRLTNMLMHNKFAIFDEQKVYTGSMNFSATGLSGFNQNSVLIINSKAIADLYKNEFNQMYSGKFHTQKTLSKNNTNIKSGSSIISVYFSPQDKGLTEGVVPIIRQSKKYVYVPTFLISHDGIKKELINAHNRGVDVKIIIDANNTRTKAFKELRAANVPVKTENYAGKMHSKSLIADDEYIVVGSENFSYSGENKNDENLVIIKNSKLTILYKDFFNYLWARIPNKYLTKTIRPEGLETIGSCYDGIDNNFDGRIDNSDEGCKKNTIKRRK